MKWIDTDRGMINMDHVARIHMTMSGERKLEGYDGKELGRTNRDDFELLTDIIVPAGQLAPALLVTWNPPDELPSDDDTLYSEQAAIVAWRINELGAFPILAGDAPARNQTILIVHPDGRHEEPLCGSWASRELALDAIRGEKRWKQPE